VWTCGPASRACAAASTCPFSADVLTKSGAFWLYAFFGVCAVVFFATLVPETKDRSLEQIQSEFGADADDALSRDRPQSKTPQHA